MKRIFGVVGVLIAVSVALFGQPAHAVNTYNFSISSFDIQYELSRDSEGHSVLKTTEKITAEFPHDDQNHGLERALPSKYDGHSLHLAILSVTDATGNELEYSTSSDDDVELLRIGSASTYVHGTHTYEITYTQQDVTKTFSNTNKDEWYWDTNGTVWRVPIKQLTVSMTMSDDISAARRGAPYCYFGVSGSKARCAIEQTTTGYSLALSNVQPGGNASVAFGFNKGTFTPYQPTLWERLFSVWVVSLIVLSILGFIFAAVITPIIYNRRRNRTKELHTIPVEYLPPKNTSVTISAQVVTPVGSAFGAQLIDLAVRHIIAIIETQPKSSWRAAEYDIKVLMDVTQLSEEEQEIVTDMFGSVPAVNDRLSLSSLKTSSAYARRIMDNDRKVGELVSGRYGLREKSKTESQFFYNWAIAMVVIGLVTVTPPLFLYALLVVAMGATLRPLTDKGLELRCYLLGLDTYISAAEEERLKFLQGPDTAQKVGERVDIENPGQILKLYERVLPYAILFGREKEWTERLGTFYDTTKTAPDWYQSSSGALLSSAVFSSAISSFSSATSYSSGGASSSSSIGGSSGGGSSGGGGGGGGGGGW